MPIALEAPGVKLRSVGGQGGMAISHYVTTEPADMGPVLKSLPNGNCSVPHWGYVIKGKGVTLILTPIIANCVSARHCRES